MASSCRSASCCGADSDAHACSINDGGAGRRLRRDRRLGRRRVASAGLGIGAVQAARAGSIARRDQRALRAFRQQRRFGRSLGRRLWRSDGAVGDRAPGERNRHRALRFVRASSEGFLPLVQAILPTRPGKPAPSRGHRSSPAIPSCGGIWVIFYTGGGAIGWATAPAITLGHNFAKAPGPALLADGAEEGTELTSPAVVRHRRSRARLLPRLGRDLGRGRSVGRRGRRPRDDLDAARWRSVDTRARPDVDDALRGRCRSRASRRAPTRRRPGACATISTSRRSPRRRRCSRRSAPAASPARSPAIASRSRLRRSCRSRMRRTRRPKRRTATARCSVHRALGLARRRRRGAIARRSWT